MNAPELNETEGPERHVSLTESHPPPRLGVLDFHPIQYHVPLYQRLARRGRIRLDVLYLRDAGYRAMLRSLIRGTRT